MAIPCKPFARAAAIKSSGLETPSPEKNEWVWRSKLNGILGKVGWTHKNGKYRFEEAGHGLRSPHAVEHEIVPQISKIARIQSNRECLGACGALDASGEYRTYF